MLRSRTASVRTDFLQQLMPPPPDRPNDVILPPLLSLVISPMLEDKYRNSTAYKNKLGDIVAALPWSLLTNTEQFRFRRAHSRQGRLRYDVCPRHTLDGTGSACTTLQVEHEIHAMDDHPSYEALSNDGSFVYDANHEDRTCTKNANENSPIKLQVKAFKKLRVKHTLLLWRPVFNLLPRSTKRGKYCYTTTKVPLADRSDSMHAPVLDQHESEVIGMFLKD